MTACFPASPFPESPFRSGCGDENQHFFFVGMFISCNIRRTTHPALSTTGAWSKPFSFRILMVCWQLTVGRTVSGADRFRLCTFRFHHLAKQVLSSRCGSNGLGYKSFLKHIPRLLHHDVLLPQEAFLDHPLITQEL